MRVIALCCSLACGLVFATAQAAEPDAALKQRAADLQAVEGRLDADAAAAFWAPDGVAQMPGAPKVEGRDAIRAAYKQFFATSGIKRLEGTSATMQADGDVAWETGVNHFVFATPTGDIEDVGKYLVVWKKIDGQWYVVAGSANSDAPAPKPVAATTGH